MVEFLLFLFIQLSIVLAALLGGLIYFLYNKQKKFDAAIADLVASIKLAKETGAINEAQDKYLKQLLALLIYKKEDDIKDAYHQFNKFIDTLGGDTSPPIATPEVKVVDEVESPPVEDVQVIDASSEPVSEENSNDLNATIASDDNTNEDEAAALAAQDASLEDATELDIAEPEETEGGSEEEQELGIAFYQAKFMSYLESKGLNRGVVKKQARQSDDSTNVAKEA